MNGSREFQVFSVFEIVKLFFFQRIFGFIEKRRSYLVLLNLGWFSGQKLLEGCVPVTILRGRRSRCTRCAWIAAGSVWRVGPGDWAAGTHALVDFATGMMIFRVTSQAPRVAIRFAAPLGFALEWFFISVCYHVAVSVGSEKSTSHENIEIKKKNFQYIFFFV